MRLNWLNTRKLRNLRNFNKRSKRKKMKMNSGLIMIHKDMNYIKQ